VVPDGGVVEDGGGVVGLLGLSGDGDVRVVSPRGVISESAAAPAESRDCRRLLAAESAALFTVLAAESVIDCTVPEAESRTVGAGGGGVVVELGGVVRMVVSRIVVSRIMVLLSVGLGAIGEVDGGVDGGVDGDVTDGDGEVVDGLVVDGLVVSGDVVDGDTSPPCSLLMRFRSCAPTVPADTRSAAAVSAATLRPRSRSHRASPGEHGSRGEPERGADGVASGRASPPANSGIPRTRRHPRLRLHRPARVPTRRVP